jgi:hypothetical protein
MTVAADVVWVLLGVGLVLAVFDSALRTFVLPRGVSTFLTRLVFVTMRRLFRLFANERRSYEARDRVMALYGPVTLFGLVFFWMALAIVGFMFIYHGAFGVDGWAHAFQLSGSSFFTLGFALVPSGVPSSVLVFIEAASGLGLLALLIAYLPTIYGAFSRRELGVARLAARAGTPPSAPNLLIRFHQIGWNDQLPALWGEWEAWFAEISETHTTFPVLMYFRSPNPNRSWLTAAGALLDAAAIAQSTLSIPWSPEAALCIRNGYLTLRELAGFLRIPYDPDPAPDAPISIARSEFDEVYERLGAEGAQVRPDRERAWRDFAGWRVNYDQVLIALTGVVMAPYAPWSSDRSLRFRPRVVRTQRAGFAAPRSSPRPPSGPR